MTFAKYVRLTTALQYNGDNADEIIEFIHTKLGQLATIERNAAGAIVNDVSAVNIGDYVVVEDGPIGFAVIAEADFERDHVSADAPV